MQYINPSDFITRLATSIGIDAKGLVLSEQEIQQRQQMAMMQQMMQQAAGPLAQEGAGAMRDQMQPNGE